MNKSIPGNTTTIVLSPAAVKSTCGFCGLEFIADWPTFLLVHLEPRCRKFDELDPIDFLEGSRLEHERKGASP